MTESIFIQLGDNFLDAEQKEKDSGYYLLKLTVPFKLLYDLYLKFMNDGLTPIEQLPIEKKQKYFNISKKYYTEIKDQIKASKAAYTLDLITNND